jgi:hypothetical protein
MVVIILKKIQQEKMFQKQLNNSSCRKDQNNVLTLELLCSDDVWFVFQTFCKLSRKVITKLFVLVAFYFYALVN